VFLNCPVAMAFAVPEILALVNQHDPIAGHVREFIYGGADRDYLGSQPVLVNVVVPHLYEVLGADDEGFEEVWLFLKNARQSGSHQTFSKSNYVAQHHAASLVKVMRRDPHRRC